MYLYIKLNNYETIRNILLEMCSDARFYFGNGADINCIGNKHIIDIKATALISSSFFY